MLLGYEAGTLVNEINTIIKETPEGPSPSFPSPQGRTQNKMRDSKRYSNQMEKKNSGHSIPISDKEVITTKSIIKDKEPNKNCQKT